MARGRSAPLLLVVAACAVVCMLVKTAFVPAPSVQLRGSERELALQRVEAAAITALTASAASLPAYAIEEESDFDYSLLIVLGLPLTAASWAIYNVWRVGFRQLNRIGESESGSSKFGLGADD
eukprot:TRINITY_DN4964_c0_g4_i1.p2 TRINITY_DN4964_c0_g4~~TRINITY_DN4964_c0_g4_i1.p2  ORF type:complete len:123 (+),score=35.11 TRINITY_DN4964_c0_g4_i1:88-456(+)